MTDKTVAEIENGALGDEYFKGTPMERYKTGSPITAVGFHWQFPKEAFQENGRYSKVLDKSMLEERDLCVSLNPHEWSSPNIQPQLIYRVIFKLNNPLVLKNSLIYPLIDDEDVENAKRAGHDGLVVEAYTTTGQKDNDEIILFNPKKSVGDIQLLNPATMNPLFNAEMLSYFKDLPKTLEYCEKHGLFNKLLKLTLPHYVFTPLGSAVCSTLKTVLECLPDTNLEPESFITKLRNRIVLENENEPSFDYHTFVDMFKLTNDGYLFYKYKLEDEDKPQNEMMPIDQIETDEIRRIQAYLEFLNRN